jgi:hypothetical protein
MLGCRFESGWWIARSTPHVPVWDKSARHDGTFSPADFVSVIDDVPLIDVAGAGGKAPSSVQYRAHPDALRAGEEPPPSVGPMKSGLSGVTMTENRARNGKLGVIIGALIAVGLAVFLLTGGEHVGKKTVNSDADLPPIAKGQSR